MYWIIVLCTFYKMYSVRHCCSFDDPCPTLLIPVFIPRSDLSSVRHSRGADTAEHITGSAAELNVDDAVQDEVHGEVDEVQAVDDDGRRLVGEVNCARPLRTGLQKMLAEEVQQSRRPFHSTSFQWSRNCFQRSTDYFLVQTPVPRPVRDDEIFLVTVYKAFFPAVQKILLSLQFCLMIRYCFQSQWLHSWCKILHMILLR